VFHDAFETPESISGGSARISNPLDEWAELNGLLRLGIDEVSIPEDQTLVVAAWLVDNDHDEQTRK